MAFKKTSFTLAFLVVVLLALNFASASDLVTTLNSTSATIYAGNSTSFLLNISNNATSDIYNINVSSLILTSGSHTITLGSNTTFPFNLTAGTSKLIILTANTSSTQTAGDYTNTNIVFAGQNASNLSQSFSSTQSLTVKVNSTPLNVCKSNNNTANLIVTIDKVEVDDGFGDEDNFWYPFDKVSMDVNVENNGDWDVRNIDMKFCLRDKSSSKCIIDEDSVDFSTTSFDLKSGKDKDITLKFTVNSDVLDEDYSNLEFYVSATGDIKDSDSVDNGKESCAFDNQPIEINTGEAFVILTDLDENTTTTCGSTITVSGKAWNIDGSDLEGVTIEAYNKELGIINKEIDVGDIDNFDYAEFSATFNIPQNVSSKTYGIRLTVYDEDGDVFNNNEDDDAIYSSIFNVQGCQVIGQTPIITANLTSVAKVGENLVIQALVKNTGSDTDFIITPSSYESWAELVSVQPQTARIASGLTTPFAITLKPIKSGAQTFNIEARTVSGATLTQPVQVSIAAKPSLFSGLTDSLGNTGLFLIVAILILFILIIVVAVIKLAKKPSKQEF